MTEHQHRPTQAPSCLVHSRSASSALEALPALGNSALDSPTDPFTDLLHGPCSVLSLTDSTPSPRGGAPRTAKYP